jgi:thiopurine S-methyltransferase
MMDKDFWLERWHEGKIGFHQDRVTPLLEKYWDALELPAGSTVFVPLAGKSLDMAWLAARGHRVLGVELSELAVQQFFAEHGLVPTIGDSRFGRHYVFGSIELICGDAFALDAALLADCAAVYDRAALIALPPTMRQRYADELYARLPTGCRGLLVTLEYPQHEKAGPPFSVEESEVHALFGRDWRIDLLERRDILAEQPGFIAEGVSALHISAYRLCRTMAGSTVDPASP